MLLITKMKKCRNLSSVNGNEITKPFQNLLHLVLASITSKESKQESTCS